MDTRMTVTKKSIKRAFDMAQEKINHRLTEAIDKTSDIAPSQTEQFKKALSLTIHEYDMLLNLFYQEFIDAIPVTSREIQPLISITLEELNSKWIPSVSFFKTLSEKLDMDSDELLKMLNPTISSFIKLIIELDELHDGESYLQDVLLKTNGNLKS